MLGILGRVLPWVLILWAWYALNRALDKVDSEKAKKMASPFWSKIHFLWGWAVGAQSKFTILRYIISGVVFFLVIRWIAASLSTPLP